MNRYNKMHNEIKLKIFVADKGNYAVENIFKTKHLSRLDQRHARD